MTFEEAIELIKEECRVETEDGFYTKERDLDTFLALSIIKNLQETYAPKIKMTKKQKQAIEVDLLGLFGIDSDTDWETGFIDEDSLGVVVVSELSGLAEDDVVRAWLHPELIEVSDD